MHLISCRYKCQFQFVTWFHTFCMWHDISVRPDWQSIISVMSHFCIGPRCVACCRVADDNGADHSDTVILISNQKATYSYQCILSVRERQSVVSLQQPDVCCAHVCFCFCVTICVLIHIIHGQTCIKWPKSFNKLCKDLFCSMHVYIQSAKLDLQYSIKCENN